jgi:hypothetical protein
VQFRHRHDAVPARPGIRHVWLAGAQAADSDLDDVMAGPELRDVPDRVAVRPLHAVDEGPVVQVRVEVDDVEALLLVRPDHRVGDRVVPAEHDWKGAGSQDPPDARRDVVERSGGRWCR